MALQPTPETTSVSATALDGSAELTAGLSIIMKKRNYRPTDRDVLVSVLEANIPKYFLTPLDLRKFARGWSNIFRRRKIYVQARTQNST